MYVRLITFNLEPGMYKTVEKLADRFIPILSAQQGLITTIFFVNDAAAEYGALTLWESEEDIEAEATIVIPRLQDALAGLNAAPPFVRLFEVYEPHT
jgi:quinol monooxygenase YgiN